MEDDYSKAYKEVIEILKVHSITNGKHSVKINCDYKTLRTDKVKYNNTECFIFGRRASGYFDIRLLDNTKISAGISYKKLMFISCRKNILIERKIAVSSHD